MNHTTPTATRPCGACGAVRVLGQRDQHGPAYDFTVDEMTPGLWRVSLVTAQGNLINRRRDVATDRIETVKAALLAEEAGR